MCVARLLVAETPIRQEAFAYPDTICFPCVCWQAVYFKWLQPSEPEEQGHAYVHLTTGEEPSDILHHEGPGQEEAGVVQQRLMNSGGGQRTGQGQGETQGETQGQGAERVSFWEGFCR